MGFGISGSTAIIFLGVLIATGTLYTATSNASENVLDAQHADVEQTLEQKNTAITISNATYNTTTTSLVVNATNTGASTLAVDETTLLVDNVYNTTQSSDTTVDGNQATNLWFPGEYLLVNISLGNEPGRVKLVTGTGVAATQEVA